MVILRIVTEILDVVGHLRLKMKKPSSRQGLNPTFKTLWAL